MKNLYKSTKVIWDAHQKQYMVYYKNFLFWHLDYVYKYDTEPGKFVHYRTKDKAKEEAIARAEAMLETVEVWKRSQVFYY